MLRRRIFEGFGGLKGVVNAARSGMAADHEITFHNSGVDMEPADGGSGALPTKVTLIAIRADMSGSRIIMLEIKNPKHFPSRLGRVRCCVAATDPEP